MNTKGPLSRLSLAAVLVLSAFLTACDDSVSQAVVPVRVGEAYFRLPVAGRTVSSAYLTLHNRSDQPQVLAGFTSPQVRAIELHQNSTVDGVMRMRRIEQFVLAPGETLKMQPGGYHLMLFGLSGQLAEGAKITIELMLASGDNIEAKVPARAVR